LEDSIEPFRVIGNTNSKDVGKTFRIDKVEPMHWKGVAMFKQIQLFLENCQLNQKSTTELAE
jgi:hypothetical protein